MGKYLKKFDTHAKYLAFTQKSDFIKPNVSHCITENHIHYNPIPYDYSKDYLTFVALESGTFTLTIGKNVPTSLLEDVSYSLDKGKTWTTVQNQDNEEVVITTPIVESYNNVLWKGNGISTSIATSSTVAADRPASSAIFSSDGKFNIEGNIMSLLYGSNYQNQTSFENDSTSNFALLFYSYNTETKANIVSIENLVMPVSEMKETSYLRMFQGCSELTKSCKLPATTLADYCYTAMFYNCTSLTTAPELPATTLATSCYSQMFQGCTSLTTPPRILPAMVLTRECYLQMFWECSSLTSIPELPATTLAYQCYRNMFGYCTGLGEINIELPEATLAEMCYHWMFAYCSNITKAPDILTTTLSANNPFRTMFIDCKKLSYIKAMFLTTPSNSYTLGWVNGVASKGIFVKHIDATWTNTGNNACPSGWTVIYYNPETDKYYLSDKTTECDNHGNVI